jgi:putative SOS response-associated peptidase YedK
MCGRYNFTVEENDEIKEILEKLNAKFQKDDIGTGEEYLDRLSAGLQRKEIRTGEIFPTNQAPILIEEMREASPALSAWGFPKFDQKGVIINARAETAFEKKTFRDSLLNRRCIIPSTGFYEWNSNKQKFLFREEGTSTLYMAGMYAYFQEEMRFVILTTDANASMIEVHNRMPLVIPKKDINVWLFDPEATNELLHRVPPLLRKEAV